MASIATLARVSVNEFYKNNYHKQSESESGNNEENQQEQIENEGNTSMYDGSWSEWILSPETNPVEVSSPPPSSST